MDITVYIVIASGDEGDGDRARGSRGATGERAREGAAWFEKTSRGRENVGERQTANAGVRQRQRQRHRASTREGAAEAWGDAAPPWGSARWLTLPRPPTVPSRPPALISFAARQGSPQRLLCACVYVCVCVPLAL